MGSQDKQSHRDPALENAVELLVGATQFVVVALVPDGGGQYQIQSNVDAATAIGLCEIAAATLIDGIVGSVMDDEGGDDE